MQSSVEQNSKLENILSDMDVIKRGNFGLDCQNADLLMMEKFGPNYPININKKKVLNNWITDNINSFERRQDESMKNLELQSKLNDNSTHIVDSSHQVLMTNTNTNKYRGGYMGKKAANSNMSSQSQINRNLIMFDDQ